MKAIVDKSGCIACGLCVSTCPEVFRMGADGLAEAYADVTDALQGSAEEARDGCPVSVIDIGD
jgi:ferredoxin